jgi:hypothetical protein
VLIGIAVLGIAVLLWLYRKIGQDHETPALREDAPAMPDAHAAALLQAEMRST